MIDIKQKTIRYGDSLQLPRHRPLLQVLKIMAKGESQRHRFHSHE